MTGGAMSDGAARPGRADPDAAQVPRVVQRREQPYASIRGEVSMQTIAAIADRLPELIGLLEEQGTELAGAPFLKYVELGPGDELVIEAGVPVHDVEEDEGAVRYGVLPAGRFAMVSFRGHPEGLMDATRDLLEWGDDEGLRWDMAYTDESELWGCRLEVYNTDPREEPDPDNWETDLIFRLAD
jgi:effector-binding domain-containing protein